jgi:hypothetical protein
VGLSDAAPLGFGQYLGRNMAVWLAGLALGVPGVNLLVMAYQAARLARGKQASYDESAGYRVRAEPVVWARTTIFVVAFLILIAFTAAWVPFQLG